MERRIGLGGPQWGSVTSAHSSGASRLPRMTSNGSVCSGTKEQSSVVKSRPGQGMLRSVLQLHVNKSTAPQGGGKCKIESVPLVPPYIESLRPYEAGRMIESVRRQYGLNHVAKLASNENPLGASLKAIEAMTRDLIGLNLYPNGGLDLREVLVREYDVKLDNVIAGSGSEGIMSNIIRAFLCDDDEVLTTDAAFIGFQVLAKSRGVKYHTVPYDNWHYDLPALAAQINENTKII